VPPVPAPIAGYPYAAIVMGVVSNVGPWSTVVATRSAIAIMRITTTIATMIVATGRRGSGKAKQ